MRQKLNLLDKLECSYIMHINPADYCTRENISCEDCSAVDVCMYRHAIVDSLKRTIKYIKEEKDDSVRLNHRCNNR